MAISEHTFRLIVDSTQGVAQVKAFRNAWNTQLGQMGRAGPTQALASFNKTLKRLMGGLGLYVGTREMIAFTKESMELARAQNDARGALISTIGSAEAYQEAIAKAQVTTRNMVSEQRLASGINSIMSMKLAKSTDEAAQLSMAGSVLSKVYEANGASMERYYRLLSGGSRVLYDNFGLTAEMVNKRAEEIQATDKVGDSEAKLQAIRELTIEQAMRYNDALSKETVQSEQASAALADFKASWGDLVNSLVFGSGAMQTATEALRSLEQGAEAWGYVFNEAIPAIKEHNTLLAEQAAQAAISAQSQLEFVKAVGQGEKDISAFKNALAAGVTSYEDYNRAVERTIGLDIHDQLVMTEGAFYNLRDAAQGVADETRYAEAAQRMMAGASRDSGEESLIAAMKMQHQIDAYRMLAWSALEAQHSLARKPRETEAWMEMGPQALAYQMGQVGTAGRGMRDMGRQMMEEHNQGLKDGAEETSRIWQQSIDDANSQLRSAIEGVLQPTLSEVWKPEGDEQRIDEWARRLATVATGGLSSEWLTQLNTQFAGMSFWQPIADAMASGDEGSLKQAASDLLTGPGVMQLWDKELIKNKVRQQFQEQNMREELVNTIMQEMGAEGIQVGAGTVQAAMGVSPVISMMMGDPTQLGTQVQSALSSTLAGVSLPPEMFEGSQLGIQVAQAMAVSIQGGLSGVQWSMMLATVFEADFGANLETSLKPVVIPVGQALGDYLAEGAAESSFSQMIIAAVMEQLAGALEE